jgi:5-methylcytosine-specific restriction endonuclease McrA
MKKKLTKIQVIYGVDWTLIATKVKTEASWTCVECGAKQSTKKGSRLTVHHIDGNPRNNNRSNLVCLCQKCHLKKHKFLQAQYLYTQKEGQGQVNILTNIQENQFKGTPKV